MTINKLEDLNKLKTAPLLSHSQSARLLNELNPKIISSDWLTIGIMASSDKDAKIALKTIIKKYSYENFMNFEKLRAAGKVFLKGNQKTGEVYIRSESGIGEGILLTCQYDDQSKSSITYGPLPMEFFCS